MLRYCLVSILGLMYIIGLGQSLITGKKVEMHMRILAADEMMGRKTGEPGNWMAARYIAEQLRYVGVEPLGASENSYFQKVPFVQISAPSESILNIGSSELTDNLMVRLAPDTSMTADLIYLPLALEEEVTSDVRGKIVLTNFGNGETAAGPQSAFAFTKTKRKLLQEHGALGVIEIYNLAYPWRVIQRYFGGSALQIVEDDLNSNFTTLLINDKVEDVVTALKNGVKKSITFQCSGTELVHKPSPNVVGVIEGTDPELKDEYVVLSAHFDHVGTGVRPGSADTIFNGARDNAIGVTALLSAAEDLGANPPRRSVLIVGFTAEEMGLIGSKYFVSNPTVPLEQMIFNLNTDGAGYTDTSLVSVMGLDRVGVKSELEEACSAYGLTVFADPAPEQNLFDRSDNVSFAAMGVPAPTFSPGFKKFDNELMKNYHQPSDEVDSMDMSYVLDFCRAYSLAARMIADKEERPRWSVGDKYEAAFKALYGQ